MTTTTTATAAKAAASEPAPTTAYPLVDTEWGEDPLLGVPRELRERIGSMDQDTAGGCG
ncbi:MULTISPECIES: hypothetical protein [unclassified Streptomyces]|jgi:hypothetical protein|uniref:hypothetical protein n=1 Tax=unclassified Streptomyces TaxID=2593676 RepID=UPI0021890D44|nr:YssX [Streptomyces sp. NA00569]